MDYEFIVQTMNSYRPTENPVRYVHTHFLRFQHTLSECYVLLYVVIFLASFFGANGVVELPYGVILCDVCSGSLPDFPFPGAM